MYGIKHYTQVLYSNIKLKYKRKCVKNAITTLFIFSLPHHFLFLYAVYLFLSRFSLLFRARGIYVG